MVRSRIDLAAPVLVGLLLVPAVAEARKPAVQGEPDGLHIEPSLLAAVLVDPQHEFTYEQMRALVELAVREETHMYNLFAALALELAEHEVSARVSGQVMRALLREYDLGGEDGVACFASPRHRVIRMGRALDDPAKVELVFTMSKKALVWVRDVPEKYTLKLDEEWGFADVSSGELGEMFGIRGGWSIFCVSSRGLRLVGRRRDDDEISSVPTDPGRRTPDRAALNRGRRPRARRRPSTVRHRPLPPPSEERRAVCSRPGGGWRGRLGLLETTMRTLTWIALASIACGPRGADDDGEDTSSTSTASGTGTGTGTGTGSDTEGETGCEDVPLCDFCPDVLLCGMPCDQPDVDCSNEIGDAMACADGTWACTVHPPLEPGDCNAICEGADGCTEIGCDTGFGLSIVAEAGPMPPGLYEVDLLLDGDPHACSFEILDDPNECGSVPCVGVEDCNALYQLSEPPHTVSLAFGFVALVEGEVRHDQVPIAPGSFPLVPVYRVVAPNGPGCGPVCAQAGLELAVP